MSSATDAKALNAALKNATELQTFELKREAAYYTLRLTLSRKDKTTVTLVCRDVQNLELNPTGDGFEKMLDLQVEDISEDALGRIQFSLEELERQTIFLHCAAIALQ